MQRLAISARRGLVAAICSYEVAAIASGRVPTVTALCGRYRWLAPAVITALAVHLAQQPRPGTVPLTADIPLGRS